MAFIIQEPFLDNKGSYGDVYWCSYEGNPTKYICKKLKDPDLGLELEMEASRRLEHLVTVYKTIGIEVVDGVEWLVSEYLPGPLLADYGGAHTSNLFLHILCTLEEMRSAGVCHNDLHAGNIIVVATKMTHVRYTFNNRYLDVTCFGVLPVIIDFGLCFIDNFRYRPVIVGLSKGSLGSLGFEPRFDKLKVLNIFSKLLTDQTLAKKAAIVGKGTLIEVAKWAVRNTYRLWEPINYEMEIIYPKLDSIIDYGQTGPLMSFPEIDTPDPAVKKRHLTQLNAVVTSVAKFQSLVVEVCKSGPDHELYAPFCTLAHFLKRGVRHFLQAFPKVLDGVPLETQWIKQLLIRHPEFRYEDPV